MAAERRSNYFSYLPIKAVGPTASFKATNIYMLCLKKLGRISKSNPICAQFNPNALKPKLQSLWFISQALPYILWTGEKSLAWMTSSLCRKFHNRMDDIYWNRLQSPALWTMPQHNVNKPSPSLYFLDPFWRKTNFPNQKQINILNMQDNKQHRNDLKIWCLTPWIKRSTLIPVT